MMEYNVFDRIVFWCKSNLDQLIIYLVVFIFVIALIPLTINYKKSQSNKILNQFVEIEAKYYSKDFELAIELADNFLKNHKKVDNYQKLSLFMKAKSLYNLKKYDKVIVVTDAAEITEGLNDLLSALRSVGNHNIMVVRWHYL